MGHHSSRTIRMWSRLNTNKTVRRFSERSRCCDKQHRRSKSGLDNWSTGLRKNSIYACSCWASRLYCRQRSDCAVNSCLLLYNKTRLPFESCHEKSSVATGALPPVVSRWECVLTQAATWFSCAESGAWLSDNCRDCRNRVCDWRTWTGRSGSRSLGSARRDRKMWG